MYAKITSSRLRAFERVLLQAAGGHFVCSDRERLLLMERNPAARIATIENGVDCSYFAATPKSETPRRLVFVGSMNYHANIEAVRYFVSEVWPDVRRRFPELTFTIVGGNPPPAVVQLGEIGGVQVTGMVPDVRPYYSDAVAAVVPLLTGGGTRLKILEAMAAGTPVITTPLGCEGLDARDSRHLLIAEHAADWPRAIDRLRDPNFRDAVVERARNLVHSRYDWSVIGGNLRSAYANWLGTN